VPGFRMHTPDHIPRYKMQDAPVYMFNW